MEKFFLTLPELPEAESKRIKDYNKKIHYEILSLSVNLGDTVEYREIIGEFGVFITKGHHQVWKDKIIAKHNGKISKIKIRESSKLYSLNECIIVIEYCPHSIEFNGLCCICGCDITNIHEINDNFKDRKTTNLIISGQMLNQKKTLKITNTELNITKENNAKDLLKSGKLLLVLDIDHTFLHATRDIQAIKVKNHEWFSNSIHSFILKQNNHSHSNQQQYFVKIRPFFKKFLNDLKEKYEIHLYTMAMRKYAQEIVNFIDPKREIIQNLVTRDDVKILDKNKKISKKLERLFPCDERMVVIIDDRIDVWPNSQFNIIQIHKYLFWPSDDIYHNNRMCKNRLGYTMIHLNNNNNNNNNNIDKKSQKIIQNFIGNYFRAYTVYKIIINVDNIIVTTHKSPNQSKYDNFIESINKLDKKNIIYNVLYGCSIEYCVDFNELKRREGDRVLPCLRDVLMNLHNIFYKKHKNSTHKSSKKIKPDTRKIIKQLKKEVFKGLKFVFSGVFPVDTPKPELKYEWMTAVEFGAKCYKTLDIKNKDGITHLIATNMGTEKVKIAQELGIEIVHPNWMFNSFTHYLRSDPEQYRPKGWKYTGKKRKHNNDSDSDTSSNNGTNNKRKKRVRFNLDNIKDNDDEPKKGN